jgi:hypothetical protein
MAIWGIALAALIAGAAHAATEGPTEEELRACLQGNVPSTDDLRSLKLTSVDRVGQRNETQVLVFARQTDGERRTLIRFTAPEELVGSAILIADKKGIPELYLHSPDLGQARKLEAGDWSQILFGSDVSYEDFLRLQGLLVAPVTKIESGSVGDRQVHRVEMLPEPGTSSYERITAAIDKERCVILEMSLFEAGGRLRKVALVDPDQMHELGGVWIPHSVAMKDVRDDTRTELEVVSVTPQIDIPDELVSPQDFGRFRPRVSEVDGVPTSIDLELVQPQL